MISQKWGVGKGNVKVKITSLNSHFAKFQSDTRYSCDSMFCKYWQPTSTYRTDFFSWPDHQIGFALEAFDSMEFEFFNFFWFKASHYVSPSQKVLVLVI